MFTLPSRVDGFGMAVPEAMACGVPAIVSDMVGAKEVIEEGHNGFIVPSGNSDALVDRMRWCICNATLMHSIRLPLGLPLSVTAGPTIVGAYWQQFGKC